MARAVWGSTERTNMGFCKSERRIHEIFYIMITFSVGEMMVYEGLWGIAVVEIAAPLVPPVSDLF